MRDTRNILAIAAFGVVIAISGCGTNATTTVVGQEVPTTVEPHAPEPSGLTSHDYSIFLCDRCRPLTQDEEKLMPQGVAASEAPRNPLLPSIEQLKAENPCNYDPPLRGAICTPSGKLDPSVPQPKSLGTTKGP